MLSKLLVPLSNLDIDPSPSSFESQLLQRKYDFSFGLFVLVIIIWKEVNKNNVHVIITLQYQQIWYWFTQLTQLKTPNRIKAQMLSLKIEQPNTKILGTHLW